MAEVSTDVVHPDGVSVVVATYAGRVPREVALSRAREQLRQQVAHLQAQLSQSEVWTTEARRGTKSAKTYEEMHDA